MLSHPTLAADRPSKTERVYFIEAVGLGVVKIGYTNDVAERMRKLSPGCPVPLQLLGTVPGGYRIEQHYHERLAGCRAHGEWFRRGEALDVIVLGIDKPPAKPPAPTQPAKPQQIRPQAAKETRDDYYARCSRLALQWAEEKQAKREARHRLRQAPEIAARLLPLTRSPT